MFNYRLAKYSDFIVPIPGKNISAKEMRGLTFVFNKNGTLYKRYILLEKFFNLNQTTESEYTIVSKLKIKQVNFKEDGSIASFIRLPNGKVIGKSKMSFNSEQAVQITNLYNKNEKIREFVNWTLENDIVAIFEFVSPNNRIVLKYDSDNLILLRMRDNKTGKHLDLMDFTNKIGDLEIAPFEDEKSLDDLILKSKTEKGREGWIITFENGLMIKIKTDEYLRLHGLFTEDLNRENTLIGLILNETIDDVLAQLEEPTKKAEIEKTIEIVNKEMSRISHEVDKLLQKYTGDRKDFALKYQKDPMFSLAMGVINGKDKIDVIKQRIKIDTKDLMKAREWFKKAKERYETYKENI
jgi:T4 RnlA family RNA ligase